MQTAQYEEVVEPGQNGTVQAMAQGPRVRRREVWADLPAETEDAYPGFRVKLWANFRRALLDELASGDNDRISSALRQIVLEHNGWCDEDGQPFPPASSESFWDAIPTELATIIVVVIRRESQRLPNLLLRTNS